MTIYNIIYNNTIYKIYVSAHFALYTRKHLHTHIDTNTHTHTHVYIHSFI